MKKVITKRELELRFKRNINCINMYLCRPEFNHIKYRRANSRVGTKGGYYGFTQEDLKLLGELLDRPYARVNG